MGHSLTYLWFAFRTASEVQPLRSPRSEKLVVPCSRHRAFRSESCPMEKVACETSSRDRMITVQGARDGKRSADTPEGTSYTRMGYAPVRSVLAVAGVFSESKPGSLVRARLLSGPSAMRWAKRTGNSQI